MDEESLTILDLLRAECRAAAEIIVAQHKTITELQGIVKSLAERVAAQSELLSKRAEIAGLEKRVVDLESGKWQRDHCQHDWDGPFFNMCTAYEKCRKCGKRHAL